ncbi:MAG: sugar phosphate isomerase/epimerase [Clostridia bacterium]|nr:sugar phosphate isomerase/epimerase [Clostridia bacterium]
MPQFYEDSDDGWKRLAHDWGEAAAAAGITYVQSHSPIVNAFSPDRADSYERALRAAYRSIEICRLLGIDRTVVHASYRPDFTPEQLQTENVRFYRDLLAMTDHSDVMILTENVDNSCGALPVATGAELRQLAEMVDHPRFGVCWDTAHGNLHASAREIGQYDNIIALGDQLKALHISDNFGDGAHHHSWPFAGIINFDAVMQGLLDVGFDGAFNFEASYTLLNHTNMPYHRKAWQHGGETVTKLLDPPIGLKVQAVNLLYDIGKHILDTYNCFEE